ncbi:MAG: GNAT family N-acetyltransferase [Pseudomonadota bacterium]
MTADPRHRRWHVAARTSDGIEYRIRPIEPEDVERERAFFATLSIESKYLRFMHCIGEPTEEFVRQLVLVDYHRTMALVAVFGAGANERFIGVARYAADDSGEDCEFAVAVSDDWQCRGIGTTLTPLLFDYAKAAGFKTIYGTVMANNQRMIELAEWLGLTIDRSANGQAELRATRRLN